MDGTAGMQKKHHELSDAISKSLAARIDTCEPDIILTECAPCKMYIQHLMGREVLHPIKLLSRAL